MEMQMLHIFRNTPLGRETLMQTAYFCRHLDILPVIYVPGYIKFLMYFENDVVQVDLDGSYLRSPETARHRASQIVEDMGLAEPKFLEPKNFTASTLPDIAVDFDFMGCPRSISDLSSKIGLGYIGPRVRRIVQSARFPVLIPSTVFKPWKSLTVLFGGSANAVKALRLGLRLSRISGLPLDVFTKEGKRKRPDYESVIQKQGLETEMEKNVRQWRIFDKKTHFEDDLFEIAHDALIVIGAYGHGLVRELFFGNTMEQVQSVCPQSMLIVGPNYRRPVR